MSHDANYRPDRIQAKPEKRKQGESVADHNSQFKPNNKRGSADCSWLGEAARRRQS